MFEVILGAIISIVITIWIENLRKPKLLIRIRPPTNGEYSNAPAQKARFLHVEVANEALSALLRWMSRNAATQVQAAISFHHLDGQNVFGRSMTGRWSKSPEPVLPRIVLDDKVGYVFDSSRLNVITRTDVYPGQAESLDIATKFDDDQECFGWSNDNYFSQPVWRNPNWKLGEGRHLVKITVSHAGERLTQLFRLINDVSRRDFRLENPMPQDKVE